MDFFFETTKPFTKWDESSQAMPLEGRLCWWFFSTFSTSSVFGNGNSEMRLFLWNCIQLGRWVLFTRRLMVDRNPAITHQLIRWFFPLFSGFTKRPFGGCLGISSINSIMLVYKTIISLQLTASLHLKINGWKMKFPFGIPYFQGRAVSFGEGTGPGSMVHFFRVCCLSLLGSFKCRFERLKMMETLPSIWETKPYFPTKQRTKNTATNEPEKDRVEEISTLTSDEFWNVFPRLFLPYKCRILLGWNNHFSLIASRLVNMIELGPINSSKAFTSFPATPSAAAQATGGFLPGSLKRKTVLCSSETGYLGGRVCEFDVYLVHQMANHCKCLLQLDDERNPYMNNGCFTRHPWQNCCLGYQVL